MTEASLEQPDPGRTRSARIVANRFRLESHIGNGRYGKIYRAVDLRAPGGTEQDSVALHIIDRATRESATPDATFSLEFERIKSSAHPNLLRLFELGLDGDDVFISMELLSGLSLRQILDDSLPETLEKEEVLRVVNAVGDALSYAHARDLVHGDVRLENVFVTMDLEIKLLDTVAMRPSADEGFADRNAATDPRRDVVGLASLAYELLMGEHPDRHFSWSSAEGVASERKPHPDLTRHQWLALREILMPGPNRRIPTVERFLERLGLRGQERKIVTQPKSQPTDARRDPAISEASVPDVNSLDRMRGDYDPLRSSSARRNSSVAHRPGRFRAVLLAILAASLGWVANLRYWEMRMVVADWFDSTSVILSAWSSNSTDDGRDVTGANQIVVDDWFETDSDRGESSIEELSQARSMDIAEIPGIVEIVGDQSTVLDTIPGQEDETEAPPIGAPADESGVAPEYDTALANPLFSFKVENLTVSEGEAAARVEIYTLEGLETPASVVWWTSEATAASDRDFVGFERTVENFAAGERDRILLIPLINDAVREDTEYFEVFLGAQRHGANSETIERLRVEIVDED